MRIEDRLGRFEDVVALAPQHRETLSAVRALIGHVHPDATEAAAVKERSISWGYGEGRMKSSYAYVMPHAAHVNLGFFQGAHLPDPDHVLEGTGKVLRHLKLRTPADVDRPVVRTLLIAARDERRAALNID